MTDDEPEGIVGRGRRRLGAEARRVERWAATSDGRRGALDLVTGLADRDRDSLASVLGSAIAMRLFLFTVPLTVAVVGLVQVLHASGVVQDLLGRLQVQGSAAVEIERAVRTSSESGIWLLLSGLVLTVWAGRSLTRVLAASAAASWRLPARTARVSVRQVVVVSALMAGLITSDLVINRIHEASGVAVTSGVFVLAATLDAAVWFLICSALPRATTDPGALLPGSALFGLVLAALSWFMHYYLPAKVERASATMGGLAVTVAALGYLFLIGRLATVSLTLDAVVWEQHGSITGVVFDLPGLRVLPRRSPRLRAFFDLEVPTDDPTDPEVGVE